MLWMSVRTDIRVTEVKPRAAQARGSVNGVVPLPAEGQVCREPGRCPLFIQLLSRSELLGAEFQLIRVYEF